MYAKAKVFNTIQQKQLKGIKADPLLKNQSASHLKLKKMLM